MKSVLTHYLLMAALSLLISPNLGTSAPKTSKWDKQLEKILQAYRKGQYSKKKSWVFLNQLSRNSRFLSTQSRSRLKAAQAQLLYNDKYPILASLYASESILISAKPLEKENSTTWKVLRKASKEIPIDFVVDRLALKFIGINKVPKYFRNDWNYMIGTALLNQGKNDQAAAYFSRLNLKNRYFLSSQYQLAMIEFEKNNFKQSEVYLRTILDKSSQKVSPLPRKRRKELVNYARIALARIFYEQGKFLESAYHYRRVKKNSTLFYDALFEQSWALFMAGKPRYALGTLHSATSPYFKDMYNPEAKVLESTAFFWLCRYDDARNSLADFAAKHSETVGGLQDFLDRQRLTPERSYQLFEDLISKVSGTSLGISRELLETAAQQDSMLLAREQYASVIDELKRLKKRGLYKSKKGRKVLEERLLALATKLQNEIGRVFLLELQAMNESFNIMYNQAQFLYIELLMGQKEQLLGRDLHNQGKTIKNIKQLKSWGQKTQTWTDLKEEYWWDEIGFQVLDVEPLCNEQEG